MYCLFCVVLCIVCVFMCTVLLSPGGYPLQLNISYHILKKCYQPRTNLVWDDQGDWLADVHSILSGWRNRCYYWMYMGLMRLGRLKFIQLSQVPLKLRLILFVTCVCLVPWFKQGDSLLFLLFTFALNVQLEVSKQNTVPHRIEQNNFIIILLLHHAYCYNCCFIPTRAHIYTLKH
jgi:hypothetical protein